jgi:uncharacterized protein with PIN domain
MDVTADASVVIAVIPSEPEKERLASKTEDAAHVVPHAAHAEIGRAFSAILKRGRIEPEQAAKAIEPNRHTYIKFVDVELR